MATFAEQGYASVLGQSKRADASESDLFLEALKGRTGPMTVEELPAEYVDRGGGDSTPQTLEQSAARRKDELFARLILEPPAAAAGGLLGFGAGSILGRGIRTAPFKSKTMQSALRGIGGSRALPVAGGVLGALYGAGRAGEAIGDWTPDEPLQEFLAEQEARMQKESSHTSSFAELGYWDTLVHLKVAQQPMPQEQQEGPGIGRPIGMGVGGAALGGLTGSLGGAVHMGMKNPEQLALARAYSKNRAVIDAVKATGKIPTSGVPMSVVRGPGKGSLGTADLLRKQWPLQQKAMKDAVTKMRGWGGRGALIGGGIGAGLGVLSMLKGRSNAQQQQPQ